MLAVPALLYTVQNNMLYVGFANLEAAIGLVTYQSKIFFTGTFSLLLLGKKVSAQQWCAMALLAAGVVCAQATLAPARRRRRRPRAATTAAAAARTATTAAARRRAGAEPGAGVRGVHRRGGVHVVRLRLLREDAQGRVEAVALAAQHPARNVLDGHRLRRPRRPARRRRRPLALDAARRLRPTVVWLSVLWQSAGGILVAVTIKYADNILRGLRRASPSSSARSARTTSSASSSRPSSSSASAPSSSPSSSTAGRPTCARRSAAGAARPSSRPPTTATA